MAAVGQQLWRSGHVFLHLSPFLRDQHGCLPWPRVTSWQSLVTFSTAQVTSDTSEEKTSIGSTPETNPTDAVSPKTPYLVSVSKSGGFPAIGPPWSRVHIQPYNMRALVRKEIQRGTRAKAQVLLV